jgi:hypothetical protein
MDRLSLSPLNSYSRLGSEAAPPIVRRARLVAALLVAAFVAFLLPAAAANASGNVDVGQKAGILADDFDFLPVPRGAQSPWALVEDATAAGGVALEQRGAPTYANHSLAVYKPVSVTDAEISVRIKATGGREDQGGGIALRLRVANGSADELISVDADIAANAWHTLRVRAVDDEFVVSLDGVWAFTMFDKTLPRGGRVALWTGTDSVTRFDSLAIAPPSPSAQHW